VSNCRWRRGARATMSGVCTGVALLSPLTNTCSTVVPYNTCADVSRRGHASSSKHQRPRNAVQCRRHIHSQRPLRYQHPLECRKHLPGLGMAASAAAAAARPAARSLAIPSSGDKRRCPSSAVGIHGGRGRGCSGGTSRRAQRVVTAAAEEYEATPSDAAGRSSYRGSSTAIKGLVSGRGLHSSTSLPKRKHLLLDTLSTFSRYVGHDSSQTGHTTTAHRPERLKVELNSGRVYAPGERPHHHRQRHRQGLPTRPLLSST